jgi:lysosomal acid lipase/cholesteryl ester hydrolase
MIDWYRYILELHRIPPKSFGTPKKVVFLQHGVAQSSGTWVVNPSSRSLGNILNVNLSA